MDDREQATAAKLRMANFRFRQTPTSSTIPYNPAAVKTHTHSHSHSRNSSITNFPLLASSATNATLNDESQEKSIAVPSSSSPRSRPNSHHRRRSSVSTRRESAEMMGIAPPLEASLDAVGEQSELRRLALWTLEGKGRSDNAFIGGFTRVEIPELNSFDAQSTLDAPQALTSKTTLSAFSMGNTLGGKRDSFGKLLISSSNSLKDQLHTLMEEEEEEEEGERGGTEQEELKGQIAIRSPNAIESIRAESSSTPPTTRQPSRHRPINLTLRPLSLTPESLPLSRIESLPTPSPTPSPRFGGLKALTLAPSPSPSPAPSSSSSSSVASRRQSLSVSPSPQPTDYIQRRQSLGAFPNSTPSASQRKSSISYKRTNSNDHSPGHLPTPGPTPTSPLPPLHAALPTLPSSSSSGFLPDLDRPLSPTEQAFLFRSHTSLLCRISDLEQAIAGVRGRLPPGAGVQFHPSAEFCFEGRDRSRSSERPSSITSMSATSEPESLPSQPSDEMLQLVSDLKSERDELMRDAEGWRRRIADLDKQVNTLTRRVEAERREGWVIRERLGLMEVERRRVNEERERELLEYRRLEEALRGEERVRMKAMEDKGVLEKVLEQERAKRDIAEREAGRLRDEMERLRARAEQADADLQALLVTPKVEVTMHVPVPRRFNSMDSQMSASSATDVEEYVPVALRTLKLNAVEEEEEDRDLPRNVTSESESDNDELAHYEDDDGLDDMIFGDDHTSSSFGSIARSNSHLLCFDLATVAPAQEFPPTTFSPSHAKTGSMERGWSFPQGQLSPTNRAPPIIDHFFECLDALDNNTANETSGLATYDRAIAKQFWHGAIQDDDDEMPPFILPAQPSPPRKAKEWKDIEAAKLDVVIEEEEEDIFLAFQSFSAVPENEPAHGIVDTGLVTPRAALLKVSPVPGDTPTKHTKVRQSSTELTIPGFKPHSGSVPDLKAPSFSKRPNSPATASPMTPTKFTLELVSKPISPTMIPQPSQGSSSPSALTTPPKPRQCIAGPTFIHRPSASPKPLQAERIATTPTKFSINHTHATKLTPPSEILTTSIPPMFIPQPKMTSKPVTRSSLLPPKPPLLTRLSIPQQTAAPVSPSSPPGLTAKLSQQMQSLTSLWSPWGSNPNKAAMLSEHSKMPEQRRVRRYVSKERQLDKLELRLRREAASTGPCNQCTNCRGGVIMI